MVKMRGPGNAKNLKRKSEGVCCVSVEPKSDTTGRGHGLKNVIRGKRPRAGKRGGSSNDGKVYLGVRVKMTVRDMLKNVRLAQGWGPEQLQDAFKKKEERVKTRSSLRASKKRCPPKSLEELAIIVEVLEEDLKTPHMKTSLSDPPASPALTGYSSDGSIIPSPQHHMSYSPWADYYQDHQTLSPDYQTMSPEHQTLSPDYQTMSPEHQTLSPDYQTMSPEHQTLSPDYVPMSPEHQTLSPDYQALSPDYQTMSPDHQALSPDHMSSAFLEEEHCPQSWSLDSSAFFWTQLQKEEMVLNNICDAELLNKDEHGRNLLHNVVCVGKRALAYAIAKRMAGISSLDLKDSYGMTALHYAAKNNHHLMVCDLIQLGAGINERNNMGKSCLHLSAEKGYTQVLEVFKQMMTDGYFVDVEATDNSGMSVLQCAAVALKATVCEGDSSSPLSSRLNSLRKEQMLETLEILLQMGSYLHSMETWGIPHSS